MISINGRESRFDLEDSTMIIRGMTEDDQCFTSERAGHFNVTIARQWAEANLRASYVRLDVLDTLRGLQRNIDLDTQRLLQIASMHFVDVERSTILLYVLQENGQHLLIDGHHRLAFLAMCAGRHGHRELPVKAFVLSHQQAEQFKLTYVQRYLDGREREISAEELLVRISGIYTSEDGGVRVDQKKRSNGR